MNFLNIIRFCRRRSHILLICKKVFQNYHFLKLPLYIECTCFNYNLSIRDADFFQNPLSFNFSFTLPPQFLNPSKYFWFASLLSVLCLWEKTLNYKRGIQISKSYRTLICYMGWSSKETWIMSWVHEAWEGTECKFVVRFRQVVPQSTCPHFDWILL